MRRLIYKDLLLWKNKNKRKPLILLGARQVGKTWILNEFGKKEFRNFFHIDFEVNKEKLKDIFSENLLPDELIFNLSVLLNRDIDIKHDLLIFDEIQAVPRALTSLKYFNEKMPELTICAAGSLLGLSFSNESFPVGKVEFMHLYPLNFEEFLLNYGEPKTYNAFLDGIKNEKSSNFIHNRILKILKEFYITGGLPDIVWTYLKDKNPKTLKNARNKQKDLITSYENDFNKHSGKINSLHISSLFNNIPIQLSQNHNNSVKKYKFKGVIPNKKGFLDLQGPIDWLVKAGLIIKVQISNRAEIPIKGFCKENFFKLYVFDIGILGAMLEIPISSILLNDYGIIKGYFAENFVATELKSLGLNSLFSWTERNSEIEFLIEKEGNIYPIEVKSGTRTKAKSLMQYIIKNNPQKAFVLSEKPLLINKETKQFIPIYYAGKLN